METFFIVTAFVFGFVVKQIGLPPLVGFLLAGFALNLMGFESSETLEQISDIGIIFLLFSIGLKVKVKNLLKPEIWGVATSHMLLTVVILGICIYGLSLTGLSMFSTLDFKLSILIAFALSFSSTVFAVKILEERGEMSAKHGKLAIGILIMQDLFAVLFITFSSGKFPSIWALALFSLFFLRKPISIIMNRSGHGELLVLLACILPIAGAGIFEYVGLKPDLGAIILGMLLAGHPKTDELANAMFGFKDLFLVGFFLTIGLADIPNKEIFWVACLLVLFVPIKTTLFYVLFTRFKLRARTSMLSSVNLANYSEFGLIVGYVAVSSGWLGKEWLVVFAVAISLTMILASSLSTVTDMVYSRWRDILRSFETRDRLADDRIVDIGESTVAVIGMGRIGTNAYDTLRERYGKTVIGIDYDISTVAKHTDQGRNVILGDAADHDFYQRGLSNKGQIKLALLTMSHAANIHAAKILTGLPHTAILAATVKFDDQMDSLKKLGVAHVFNIYDEAGAGFSDHVCLQVQGSMSAEQRQ